MTRIADDFAAIKARMQELNGEKPRQGAVWPIPFDVPAMRVWNDYAGSGQPAPHPISQQTWWKRA